MGAAELYGQSDAIRIPSGREPSPQPRSRSPFRRDYARLIHSAAFRRLQGKTQLFAGLESDFFRNRLTHSLEVAQIAEGIGLQLNATALKEHETLDLDLLRFAGLAHDLGHPPFGHTGETALDRKMRIHGGFEGNAQTLRILTRTEKKLEDAQRQLDPQRNRPIWYQNGKDSSWGLNLCARSLAAIIKYDQEIPDKRDPSEDFPLKGYYRSESSLIRRIKQQVLGSVDPELSVVECQIMDLADDIAYSTYDIEDAFKGGLLNPLDLLSPPDKILMQVARRVDRELQHPMDVSDVEEILRRIFHRFEKPSAPPPKDPGRSRDWFRLELAEQYRTAQEFAQDGFFRTSLTSSLVNRFVQAVEIDWNPKIPPLSRVKMDSDVRREIAVLKHLTYVLLIQSARFKLVAYRGTQIVSTIFDALAENPDLLPEDVRERWEQAATESQELRVICDFIAGMTDRYAVEFYARLTSDDFHTMFKPL